MLKSVAVHGHDSCSRSSILSHLTARGDRPEQVWQGTDAQPNPPGRDIRSRRVCNWNDAIQRYTVSSFPSTQTGVRLCDNRSWADEPCGCALMRRPIRDSVLVVIDSGIAGCSSLTA